MKRHGLAALAALMISGCASVPDGLTSDHAAETSYAEWIDAPRADVAARWGGSIRGAFAIEELRCLVIDAYPLDRHAVPRGLDESLGGFAACHPELELNAHAVGQRVTVRGEVRAVDIALDPADDPLPAVIVDHLHAWNGNDINAGRHYDALGRPMPSSRMASTPLRGDRRLPFAAAIRLHQSTQFEKD